MTGRAGAYAGLALGAIALGAGAVFWSVWSRATEVRDYPALACDVQTYSCTDPTCTEAMPGQFILVPKGDHDRAALWLGTRPTKVSVLRDGDTVTYTSRDETHGVLEIRLNGRNFTVFATPAAATEAKGIGAGTCRDTTTAEERA
ncbi:hypothetical protein [Mesobacterium pallidum]|uniref:hypothetical protein n=1 Tax=Mesobacterium pallidum TaxID=2872037 RepID=UPI001EE34A68|nr:hypothetical protein [Mesobacterium pallidum]